jgi:hypothetical protein
MTLALCAVPTLAQTPRPRPHDIVARRALEPPKIDGHLTDAAWEQAQPASGFTERDPNEGQPATERTDIRVLYDDTALYIGARMYDRTPARIARRLSRRDDDPDSDWITIYLDPMHDRLTGALFRVSAANVQGDAVIYNDTWTDWTWDAVWESAISTDGDGWSAELRIPLSQLRFAVRDPQIWGINIARFVRRVNETSWLEMVPKNENGLASRMVDLVGLDGLAPERHMELLPYTAARGEFIAPTGAGDPFNDGARAFAAAGLDMKYGLTSNLALNATINPDFGQAEVDPAVVNLSAFETFFPEKRTFFLAGSQIFNNFGQLGANDFWGFNTSDPQIFYSRRIGRTPHIGASGDFVDEPTATTILGASKLTGKTQSGWSIGLLEAVTGDETARTETARTLARTEVEPLTNYVVARLQRDMGRRAGAGFITTLVNRRIDSPDVDNAVAHDALVVGGDAYVFLDHSRNWVLTGKMAASNVAGSTAAIETLQEAAQRYYQRPDAPQVHFDPARTSLTGYSGRLNLNRNSGLWKVNAALWGVSPGFESNDLGFEGQADRAGAHVVSVWNNVTPGRVFRSRTVWLAKWYTWNFNREIQGDGYNGQVWNQFLNYWVLGVNAAWSRRALDDRLTRGGPSAVAPAGGFVNIFGNTDGRRPISFSGNSAWNLSRLSGSNWNGGVTINIKPSPMFTIQTGPQWTRATTNHQYVTTLTDAGDTAMYGSRYIFGALAQTQLSLTTRVNAILTPHVSIQVFMQPLLAAGDYTHLNELSRPRTYDFTPIAASALAYDAGTSTYSLTPDDAAAPPLTFSDPNFNFKSLKINSVFRWELKPGSTLYAVWTRQQVDTSSPGDFAFGRDAGALFRAPGDDVLLVKMAYWIGR